ncbi:chemotaxis protein [Helicobacter cappadocius]|uniref:Chemotaxis protein n=1 Tax=Helicobacter cappadocius TaxID=3063998 RepID=A0AA90SSV3_9HELI|nr:MULTISPECIES: chemotaxis protein [unclassified Helicobacter]MDO7253392.1 chemotaxis protein [Helicobacter sp. faydin-H75]MDP2539344.1 chemotaxis protein [Helicobacter sp. faydin-H76]
MRENNIEKLKLSSNEIELIDFRIFEMRDNKPYEGIYGINVAKVQEIIKMPEVFELPSSADYVVGVFDLRGTIIPLVDLSKWMGICEKNLSALNQKIHSKSSEEKNVIITEFNNVKIGFIVDCTKRIRRVNWQNIEPAPFNSSSTSEREKITGTTRIEDEKTLLILDLESIIDDLDLHQDNNKKEMSELPKLKFKGLVLFLEDSNSARKLIRKNLLNMGFEIIEAIDGEDGLKKLEKLYEEFKENLQEHLKLIISDVEMPKMDGFHFLSQIYSDKRFIDIPLIFNSSICDKYSAQKARDLGAKAYLVKFDADRFYDEISRILG